MYYYQNVVVEYLRADRAVFVNTECCIQLDKDRNVDKTKHWYCDAVATDFRHKTVFLCETSFATPPTSLINRLREWHANWSGDRSVTAALQREEHSIPGDWQVRVWLFVPAFNVQDLLRRIEPVRALLRPRITPLELVQPWLYRGWDRQDGAEDKEKLAKIRMEIIESVPEEMRV